MTIIAQKSKKRYFGMGIPDCSFLSLERTFLKQVIMQESSLLGCRVFFPIMEFPPLSLVLKHWFFSVAVET